MKFKSIAWFLLSAFIAVSSLAQTPVTDNEDWQRYESPVDEFTIMSPGALKVSGTFSSGDPRIYGIVVNGVYLFVLTDPISSLRNSKVVEKFVRDSGEKFPDIAKIKKAERLSFVDKSGFSNELRFVKTDSRLYLVHTLSEVGDNSLAKRFQDSFQVVQKPKAVIEINKSTADSLNATGTSEKSPSNIVTSGAGSGSARGDGTGVGPGKAAGTGGSGGIGTVDFPAKTSAERANSPLKLLSKPKAAYTDIARNYGIRGSVNLRITFLASGEIGDITPLKRLPFGLVENSIEAAKRIQFDPAYSNGSPIAVTKVLQYTYTIY